jgi:hypothetical protein
MQMIEMAENDMRRCRGNKNQLFYVQRGSMYENEFLDRDEISQTERIADPVIRKQIIEGEYTEVGDMFLGYHRVHNAVDREMKFLEEGKPDRKYLVSVDFSGGKSKWSDYTVAQVWDYTEEPYRLVYFWRIKGSDMSIPMQYEKVRDIHLRFPGKVILDGSALGGKNAVAFLADVHPIAVDIISRIKGEMLSTLKVAFDGYQSSKRKRKLEENELGEMEEMNKDWGLIRFPDEYDIIRELDNYKLDDKKLRNDIVMTMAQAIWWIEMRRPKLEHKRMMRVDWASII